MSDRKQALIAKLRKLDAQLTERATTHLHDFVRQAWPVVEPQFPFADNWHIGAICLPADASIETERGPMTIGEIVDGGWSGRVWSLNHTTGQPELRRVAERMRSPGRQLVKIETNDGRHLVATDNHPVYVSGRGYVRADAVEVGDRVVSILRQSASAPPKPRDGRCSVGESVVVAVERALQIPDAVYNIEVDGNHNYFADGLLVHNCEHLEAVVAGQIPNLGINVPPSTGKSTVVSVCFPSWIWAQPNPSEPIRAAMRGIRAGMSADDAVDRATRVGSRMRFMCASYDLGQSTRDNMRMRDLILSEWYQERWPVSLRSDQNLKCLVAGTPVLMASGHWKPIETVRAGDVVLSYDFESGRVVNDVVVDSRTNGKQPARRITLYDGATVTATLNHRFYGASAWHTVDELQIGDAVAVARRLPAPLDENEQLSKDDAFILALWLAEGGKNNTSFGFSSANTGILDRARGVAAARGWTVRHIANHDYCISAGYKRAGDTPLNLLRRYIGVGVGRRGTVTTQTIRVPDAVFAAPDDVVSEFLSTYLACDGSVKCDQNHGLLLYSTSERMVRDLALLVKRFGVKWRIRTHQGAYDRDDGTKVICRVAWCLAIQNRADVLALRTLYPYGKREIFDRLIAYYERPGWPNRGGSFATVPPARRGGEWRLESAAGRDGSALIGETDLSWRKIVEIEDVGDVETFHIETRDTSLFFIDGGILSHNTKFGTTDGGWRMGIAVGAPRMGEHPNYKIIDDPHNPKKQLLTDNEIAAACQWYDYSFKVRGQMLGASTVLIMQRLGEKDLCGYLRDQHDESWHWLILPMRWEPKRMVEMPTGWKDPREGQVGALLWPAKWTEEKVNGTYKPGTWGDAGQFQQRPAPTGGLLFKRDWFKIINVRPAKIVGAVRSWDVAGTEEERAQGGTARTAGVKLERTADGLFVITDVRKGWWAPRDVDANIKQTADLDGAEVAVREEQEPGSSGLAVVASRRRLLAGYNYRGLPKRHDKITSAKPARSQAEGGNVAILVPLLADGVVDPTAQLWAKEFLDEIELFPAGALKDQVDAFTQALNVLTGIAEPLEITTGAPRSESELTESERIERERELREESEREVVDAIKRDGVYWPSGGR